jgi:hypothetical protein
VFADKKNYLKKFTNSTLKENVAQDMDKSSMEDLCYLIELYKGDASFSKYLLTNLLEKMSRGKKLDYESFLIAFINSIQHREYLKELIDTLFNYE